MQLGKMSVSMCWLDELAASCTGERGLLHGPVGYGESMLCTELRPSLLGAMQTPMIMAGSCAIENHESTSVVISFVDSIQKCLYLHFCTSLRVLL